LVHSMAGNSGDRSVEQNLDFQLKEKGPLF
jgi:hypothetical protein